jgi:hypothetical protein
MQEVRKDKWETRRGCKENFELYRIYILLVERTFSR